LIAVAWLWSPQQAHHKPFRQLLSIGALLQGALLLHQSDDSPTHPPLPLFANQSSLLATPQTNHHCCPPHKSLRFF